MNTGLPTCTFSIVILCFLFNIVLFRCWCTDYNWAKFWALFYYLINICCFCLSFWVFPSRLSNIISVFFLNLYSISISFLLYPRFTISFRLSISHILSKHFSGSAYNVYVFLLSNLCFFVMVFIIILSTTVDRFFFPTTCIMIFSLETSCFVFSLLFHRF